MKKIFSIISAVLCALVLSTGCIKEIDPQGQGAVVTEAQAFAASSGSYSSFVSAITGSLVGSSMAVGSPIDFGYPSFYLQWGQFGQDMVNVHGSGWASYWYNNFTSIGSTGTYSRFAWNAYYTWINNCNTVLSIVGEDPDDDYKEGAGIAYCIRAMMYLDLARMFAASTYAKDTTALTVVIVDENTSLLDSYYNPRVSNGVMFDFILSDLDKAEEYLADYSRDDVYTPDLSVVYGLKARTYLTMEDWANAQYYAKLAQDGYTPLTEDEYTSHTEGFNTPTDAWMFGCTFLSTDDAILTNDADSSWGSWMILEVAESECGYAANYSYPTAIDRHLYESIPDTDYRKDCFVDFSIDEMSEEDALEALLYYTDSPDGLRNVTAAAIDADNPLVGGYELKFRPADGEHANQYLAFCVAVPIMRVEEMMLIEAEAAGMQDLSEGLALLTTFGQLRDPNYDASEYAHNEAYGNSSTSAFQNEVWWQRRVELWGEAGSAFDIKRLDKGVIRNYPNTNHYETARVNYGDYETNGDNIYPYWMDLVIPEDETAYNEAITSNNPSPVSITSDSAEATSFD